MAFSPKNGDHAIVEAVFGLAFSRPFTPAEIDRIISRRELWRDELPKMARTSQFDIIVGEGPVTIPPPGGGGVTFERVNPDGTLNWRLRVDQSVILVNCLEYTRWSDVWPRAKRYFEEVCRAADATDLRLTSLLLQYVDVFGWDGDPEDYDASMLVDASTGFVPSSVLKRGSFWHLHQGWFDQVPAGRRLERVHIDAVHDENDRPIVKIDSFLQLSMTEQRNVVTYFDDATLETIFSELHLRGKQLFREIIRDEVCQEIGLNG